MLGKKPCLQRPMDWLGLQWCGGRSVAGPEPNYILSWAVSSPQYKPQSHLMLDRESQIFLSVLIKNLLECINKSPVFCQSKAKNAVRQHLWPIAQFSLSCCGPPTRCTHLCHCIWKVSWFMDFFTLLPHWNMVFGRLKSGFLGHDDAYLTPEQAMSFESVLSSTAV